MLEIARLAALDLSEAEAQAMEKDLTTIVGYFGKLGEIDTSCLPPTSHPLEASCRTRADDETLRDKLKEGAPPEGDFFITPIVFDPEG